MLKFHQKSKTQINNIAKNQGEEKNTKELGLNELDQVAGGVSLRDIVKIDTTDVSDDTKSKV